MRDFVTTFRATDSRKLSARTLRWVAVAIAALSLLAAAQASRAKEPAEEFVRGLQERGMNELALDYLEQMKTSPLVTEEFRKQIPYFRGATLLEQSRRAIASDARSRLFDEAKAELERYASENSKSIEGANAQSDLASALVDRGKQQLAQATVLPDGKSYDTERKNRRRGARRWLEEARTGFLTAGNIYSKILETIPKNLDPDKDAEQIKKRLEYRRRLAQAEVAAAQSQFELAQTYGREEPQFKKLNQAAAAELSKQFEEIKGPLGLYSRLYEGRCYQAMEMYPQALGCFKDVTEGQPNIDPTIRKLIAGAFHYGAECMIIQEKYDSAIDECSVWLKAASPDEQKQPEWLAVRYQMANALQRKGEALPEKAAQRRKLLAEARDSYRLVSNSPGEFQSSARLAAVQLSGESEESKTQPRTFKEAYEQGREALAATNAAKQALPTAHNNNPEAVPDLESQMQQGEADAFEAFRLAMTLADNDTDIAALNEVRYFLCWLYWEKQDYYRAAVLGEFLARRYPDHPAASSAAKLAMASLERLYSNALAAGAKQADVEFEANRMAAVAEFMTRRWPGTPDAEAAFSLLVTHAIRNDKIEEAQKLLGEVSKDYRPRLELQLGIAMWGRYLELSQASGTGKTDPGATASIKDEALKLLQGGFEVVRTQTPVSETTATAGLYLVQVLLSDGKYQDALDLLTDKQVGPLMLVNRSDPAAARPEYVVEVYKAALRTYFLVSPPQGEKAMEMMQSLEKAVRDGGGTADQLTRIYFGMGVALQQQIDSMRDAGRDQEAVRVSQAFAEFLDRLRERKEGTTWASRSWLGQSYYNMAVGGRTANLASATAPPKGAARANLIKARDTYKELFDPKAEKPDPPPTEAALLAARMQLGECYRNLGQYKEALDTFSQVLKEKEATIAVQRAAAYAYQQQGEEVDAKYLEQAIVGGDPIKETGKNRIWGWLKLAQVAERAGRSNAKFRDTFFEARLNVSRCRYLAATKAEGDAKQQDLDKAKQSIQSMLRLYPDLGGDAWRPQYDALMKQIQKAGDQQELGLEEFTRELPTENSSEKQNG